LGRPVKARVSALRPIVGAREVDFRGAPLYDLCVDGGAAIVELAAGQWIDLEARW
jgi:hypothetical protein